MEHGPISASQFPSLLSEPPQLSAAWDVFTMHVVAAPTCATARFADHVLGLTISGSHRLRQEVDGRVFHSRSDPGCVQLMPARLKITTEASLSPRVMALFMPDAFLSRVIAEHWGADSRNVEILWQTPTRDAVAESVMMRLVCEAKTGSPSGRLYAESACEFLANHVIRMYSSMQAQTPPALGGLPAGRLKMVLEYIQDNLAQSISLRQLSELSGVSARHFERAFRQALGVPPHTFVVARRVAAARDLLLGQRGLTIDEIAVKTGFSSGSHLAAAFRRATGYSPAEFRRQAL